MSTAEPAQLRRPTPPPEAPSGAEPTASRLALVLTFGLAGFAGATSVTLLAAGQGEAQEWLLFALTFAAILPASLAVSGRLARALERGGGAVALRLTAVTSASGLLCLVIAARGAYALTGQSSLGSPLFLAGLAAWALGTAVLVRRAVQGGPAWIASAPSRLWALPFALVAVALLAFPPASILRPWKLALAVLLAAVLLWGLLRLLRLRPRRRLGWLFDAGVVGLVVLVGADLSLYQNTQGFLVEASELHHNFYLGPVNDVLHGRPMLVETFSQYGVGIFYLLAGWFKLAPLGHGALALLSTLLTALAVAGAYAIFRMARMARPLAAVAVVPVLIGAFFAPPASYPSMGALRFGLPYLLIAAMLLGERSLERSPRPSWALRAAPLAVLGVASVWSMETFAYCLAAFAGMTILHAVASAESTAEAGGRRAVAGALVRALGMGAAACVAAHGGFALLTLLLTGALPNWGWYLDFLRAYAREGTSTLVAEPWSPGIAVCAVYFASAAALATVATRAPRLMREERVTLAAIAGATCFGFASFTYFLGISFSDRLLVVAIPCSMTIALWLALLERRRGAISPAVRMSAMALPALAAAMLVVFAWPTLEQRVAGSALALSLPDGGSNGSLRAELARMWRSPPLSSRASEGARLLRRHFPGEGPALVAAKAESTVDVLVQSRRANLLPVSHFLEESVVIERSWPRVRRALDRVKPGTLMLTEVDALDPARRGQTPHILRDGRARDPLPGLTALTTEVPLLRRTLAHIQARFELQPVEATATGFLVVRLVPRRGSARELPRSGNARPN